ncbi:MAG: hypothetical protein AAFR45_02910 [Pseudomonadota bacterium]
MKHLALVFGVLLASHGVVASAQMDPVQRCLSCHLTDDGGLNIVGIRALSALPSEWPYLFEDAFDLDGDGIAGRMRYVSAADGPLAAKFGQTLAAARFEDFALIAGAAHDIDLTAPGSLAAVQAAFETLSPVPSTPFPDRAAQTRFEARGCARCHVTETFEFKGRSYMPLSDFLLHDLGDGPRRTAPLWGCSTCVLQKDPHGLID